jgi:hypothetical protein
MHLALTRYLNQAIFVSIPALFEDGTALSYTLLGAELNGLWLQSDQLTKRLLGDEGHQLAQLNPAVFVPFAQIAGVIVATSMPEPPAPEPPNDEPKTRAARKPRTRAAPASRRR